MAALPKRIIKETERLVSDPVPGIIATPSEDNLRYFEVTIIGPNQSPYAKGNSNWNYIYQMIIPCVLQKFDS